MSAKKTMPPTATRTTADVIKDLADVKIKTTAALDAVGNDLSSELKKLAEVKMEIEAAKQELADVHGITVEAETLATVTEREAEAVAAELQAKSDRAEQRRRDEEQYAYDTAKKRRDEKDKFDAELRLARKTQEELVAAELVKLHDAQEEAQKALIDAEAAKTTALKSIADAEKEKSAAVAIATNSIKRDLEHKHQIEVLGLNNQIAQLTSQLATAAAMRDSLNNANQLLTVEAKAATQRVQEIASEAIKGAAQSKVVVQQAADPGATQRR